MAYDAQALGFYSSLKDDPSLDPSAGLVPLTSSLIPPIVAQAFGLPSLSSAVPPPPQPPQQLPFPQHAQGLYAQAANPALAGAFGYGGAQYAAAIQSQFGVPLGYLQALAAASQQHQQHQQQQQQQQQQQTAAALLAQTAGALHAHTVALAAAARAAPATSSAISQPMTSSVSVDAASGRAPLNEPERAATTSAATTSSIPAPKPAQAPFPGSAAAVSYQHPLMHNLYASLAQQHAAYGANTAASYAAAMNPYAASHLHSAYYGRPPEVNPAAAAAAAAAAANGAYGYQAHPSTVSYGSSFPSAGYPAPSMDYSAALAGTVYRPIATPAAPAAPAPSAGAPSASMGGDDEDRDDGSTRAIKRPRLVWTPQLHRKFETAVTKLGVEKAVPKNIMQEMNIDGLTRENIASHLQKYRMLRRKDTTSTSDGRDSDTRTAGSKRSEPEGGRSSAPPVASAVGTTVPTAPAPGSGSGSASAAVAAAAAAAAAVGGGGGGGGPPPASNGVSVKA